MEGGLVISFRASGRASLRFFERARALIARAAPLQGVVVGWDALKILLAFESKSFVDVVTLATTDGPDTLEGDEPWAIGIAHGELKRLDQSGASELAWGPPVLAASVLSSAARPGEILCARTLRVPGTVELLTTGIRSGRDGTLRVRGVSVDRRQPWRRHAIERLSRMRVSALVRTAVPEIVIEPGAVVVLRADAGLGGTRLLTELAERASRALVVAPVGSGREPLGALRRAFGRAMSREPDARLAPVAEPLEALLAGKGVSLDAATSLVTAFLGSEPGTQTPTTPSSTPGIIVLDDVKSVDPASVEACVRATQASLSFGLAARLDGTSGLPAVLAALPRAAEAALQPLTAEASRELASGCTSGALDPLAVKRWARIGGGVPLAIVEAITSGIARGDIAWSGDRGVPRSRASGRGRVRPAADWIVLRAQAESAACRAVLAVVAMLGGEAQLVRLSRVFERAGQRIDVAAAIEELARARWVIDTQEDWVGLLSHTHREALVSLLDDDARKRLHRAIADVIESEEEIFGRVEAAWHAAQAGEGTRAAPILLEAARATAEARLEASTTQLIAFARRVDPTCEEAALELLANALGAPSAAPSAPSAPARPPLPPPPPPPSSARLPAPPASSARLPAPPTVPQPSTPQPPASSARLPAPPTVPQPSTPQPSPSSARLPAPPTPPQASTRQPSISQRVALADGKFPPQEPDSMLEHGLIAGPDGTTRRSVSPAPTSRDGRILSIPPNGGPTSASHPPPSASAAAKQIAVRLGELAKDALLSADNAALERWATGRSTGEHPSMTERLRAMARLGRGDIGDALRVLRRTRAQLDPKDHRLRCQTSLAIAVALSVAGRPQDALLEGMDALARARQVGDVRGAKACLAFLAKLYTSVERTDEGERLRAALVS